MAGILPPLTSRLTVFGLVGPESTVSPRLWIYFVVMIPLTALVVGAWFWWDRRQEGRFASQDQDIEATYGRYGESHRE